MTHRFSKSNRQRKAFTLIELVVVILILGIVAGIAVPKLLSMSGDATDNALKQSLSVIRDAIELYAADNLGALPPCTDPGSSFQIAVQDYIRGDFPICPVGNLNVLVRASFMDPLAADNVAAGWMYNPATGEFICNSMAATTSNPLVSYDEL